MTSLLKTLFTTTLTITLLVSCTTNPSTPNTESSLPDPVVEESPATALANNDQETIALDTEEKTSTDSIVPTEKPVPNNTQQPSISEDAQSESLPTTPLSTTANNCDQLETHIYCLSATLPTPPNTPHPWGELFSYSPEIFCASDLSIELCSNVTSALLAAIIEWGNYGPVEYWVLGIDEAAGAQLIQTYCDRRDFRKQWNMDECIERESSPDQYGFNYYRRIGADAVESGQPSVEAARGGAKHWGFHLFTSSIPVGFTDYFDIPGWDEQKIIFHEYFHGVQMAHVSTADSLDGPRRDETEGPVWFVEGGAEYMALKATQKALSSGVLDQVNTRGQNPDSIDQTLGREMFLWKMDDLSRKLSTVCPDVPIRDIGWECESVSYDVGTWAHAYLANKFGNDTLLKVFYPALDELEWEDAFRQTYQMTSDQFYIGLREFIELPIEEQTKVLDPSTTSAPSMSDAKPVDNEAESQKDSVDIDQEPVILLTSTNSYCDKFDTHFYCVSSELPAPSGPLPWGAISSYSPEVFCASDLSAEICGWVTTALLTAVMEWGNYGPLEYWVLGIDADDANALTQVQCQRRTDRGQWNMQDCMQRHSPQGMHGFDYYRKVGADAIASGRPSGSAGLNGDRQMGIHFFTSSIPVGFTDYFQVPGAEEQKTVFHEYFHAIQHSYIFTEDRRKRDELLGPVWFNEGAAEFMAQVTSRDARASGALEDINSIGRWPFEFTQNMENFMNNGLGNIRNTCPGSSIKDLSYENSCNNVTYDLGAWAHAYLAHKFGVNVLLEKFLPNVEKLGWEETFISSYGMTSDDFYTEFDQFLQLPISEQLAILP